MPQVARRNRKGSNEQIIRLNSIGLSLTTIARIIGCHPTSITLRLNSLKIPPADTRRAFMEDIFAQLSDEFKHEVADYLASGNEADSPRTIKEYVRDLLVQDMQRQKVAPISMKPST